MAVGRWLARRREGELPADPETKPGDAPKASGADEDGAQDDGGKPAPQAKTRGSAAAARTTAKRAGAATSPPLDGFPCQLGDVVIRVTGEEAWLAGALVFEEEMPISALFVAPDAGHDTALYVRPRPRAAIAWLEPLDPGAVLALGEPPNAVEHRAIRFDRVRRLPVRARRAGVGAPDIGDVVVVAEYASAGSERLLVLKGNAGVRAFHGHELEESAYEVIASGDSTME